MTDISVGTSNGANHFGLVQPEYSGPALSTLTGLVISVGRTEISLSMWQKCCPQYHSFASFLQEQYNQPRGSLGPVCATGIYRSIGHVEFQRKYQTKIFVKGKARKVYSQLCLNEHIYKVATLLPLFDSLDETNT